MYKFILITYRKNYIDISKTIEAKSYEDAINKFIKIQSIEFPLFSFSDDGLPTFLGNVSIEKSTEGIISCVGNFDNYDIEKQDLEGITLYNGKVLITIENLIVNQLNGFSENPEKFNSCKIHLLDNQKAPLF